MHQGLIKMHFNYLNAWDEFANEITTYRWECTKTLIAFPRCECIVLILSHSSITLDEEATCLCVSHSGSSSSGDVEFQMYNLMLHSRHVGETSDLSAHLHTWRVFKRLFKSCRSCHMAAPIRTCHRSWLSLCNLSYFFVCFVCCILELFLTVMFMISYYYLHLNINN